MRASVCVECQACRGGAGVQQRPDPKGRVSVPRCVHFAHAVVEIR